MPSSMTTATTSTDSGQTRAEFARFCIRNPQVTDPRDMRRRFEADRGARANYSGGPPGNPPTAPSTSASPEDNRGRETDDDSAMRSWLANAKMKPDAAVLARYSEFLASEARAMSDRQAKLEGVQGEAVANYALDRRIGTRAGLLEFTTRKGITDPAEGRRAYLEHLKSGESPTK